MFTGTGPGLCGYHTPCVVATVPVWLPRSPCVGFTQSHAVRVWGAGGLHESLRPRVSTPAPAHSEGPGPNAPAHSEGPGPRAHARLLSRAAGDKCKLRFAHPAAQRGPRAHMAQGPGPHRAGKWAPWGPQGPQRAGKWAPWGPQGPQRGGAEGVVIIGRG